MQDSADRRQNMVNSQVLTNKVTDPALTAALLAVPRERFVPRALRGVAYVDEDIQVAEGRHLMEPMVFARLVQAAGIGASDVVLAVACYPGYSAAVLAQLAGTVVGLEDSAERVSATEERLAAEDIDNAVLVEGELAAGYEAQAPYDVVFVNGAEATLPPALGEQLGEGGRLVTVERQGSVGRAVLYQKTGGLIGRRELFDAQLPILPGFEAPTGFSF